MSDLRLLPQPRHLRAFFSVLVLFVACWLDAQAQRDTIPADTKGKEFWIAFMSSTGAGDPTLPFNPDLRLYLSCDRPTRATITFAGRIGIAFDMPVANVPLEINVTQFFDTSAELSPPNQLNEISDKSFHIVADDDITLYGCSLRKFSADAFLALPADVLTRRYIVLAYPGGIDDSGYRNNPPSEFAIVAPEDNTVIKIKPTAFINDRTSLDPFTITLNRGEVFMAQGSSTLYQDVSGTEIISSKPVAVLGGNMRTCVPSEVGNGRDFLVEQIPPLEAWGRRAILTPHFAITPQTRYTAVARIIALIENTEWSINGIMQPPLPRGQTVEIPLQEVMLITADEPILVAQYEHSIDQVNNNDPSSFPLGDPFMMVIPPPEQYDTAYAFQSIITSLFVAHYINVIVPSSSVASLRLDGAPVAASYVQVPGTGFVYAQIPVSAGAHYIRANAPFGLCVYGYGEANSYGYIGGMLFRQLVFDLDAPTIATTSECGIVNGIIYDNQFITDTGVDSVYAVDTTKNVQVLFQPSTTDSDTARYQARLLNPYQDGVVSIKALDSARHRRVQTDWIPGFTVGVKPVAGTSQPVNEGSDPVQIDTLIAFNGKRACRSFQLVNYGRFPHTLDSFWLRPTLPGIVSTDLTLPVTLNPGEQRTITICMEGALDSVQNLELHCAERCFKRNVAVVPLLTAIDTVPPGRIDRSLSCTEGITVAVADGPWRASGIASARIDTLINCTANVTPEQRSMPAPNATLRLQRIDPRRDMIYSITLTDDVGNSYTDTDTIGGFTLAVTDPSPATLGDDTLAIRLNHDWTGDSLYNDARRCDSVLLNNTGLRTLTIDNARMFGNLHYSIPPSQFPLSIAPGSSRMIAVCLEGANTEAIADTMQLMDACGTDELVAMKAPLANYRAMGTDICNNTLRIDQFAQARRTFLMTPTPNPITTSTAHVDVGLVQDEVVRLELIGSDGQPALLLLSGIELQAGVSRIEFDTSTLQSGSYFCRLITGSGGVCVEKVVVNR